jgi:hypothetical protein
LDTIDPGRGPGSSGCFLCRNYKNELALGGKNFLLVPQWICVLLAEDLLERLAAGVGTNLHADLVAGRATPDATEDGRQTLGAGAGTGKLTGKASARLPTGAAAKAR